MKKKLLSLVAGLLLSTGFATAQTTTWNFSTWPAGGGYTTNTVVDNLGFIAGPSSSSNLMGQIEGNTTTFDENSFTQRMKLNGGSYTSGTTDFTMPTQRAVFFDVNGNSTIKVWYKNGGGGTRTLYVTNGTAVLNSFPYTDSTVGQVATVNYTGGATRIYIAADQSMNIYQISATNVATTTLATSAAVKLSANVFSDGNQVYLSKLADDTEVNVFSMTGALVKNFKTKADTNFTLKTGIYIVSLKSAKGSLSQKVIVK